jgi:hypothetical protein
MLEKTANMEAEILNKQMKNVENMTNKMMEEADKMIAKQIKNINEFGVKLQEKYGNMVEKFNMD